LNHISLAEAALKRELCDRLIIAPRAKSIQKKGLAAPTIRLEMLRLLIEDLGAVFK
jgi:nicotinic acid mononucleotide adenylyltransferase